MLVLSAILGLGLGMLLTAQYFQPSFGSHYKNGGPFKTLETRTEDLEETRRRNEQRRAEMVEQLQGKEIDPADLPSFVLEQLVEKYK